MSDRLVKDLKRWWTEEFNLPAQSLPNDRSLKTICVGSGVSIWKYLVEHALHEKTVKRIRGNLQWYQVEQHKEGEALKRQQMQEEVEALRAELTHLDAQISGEEAQLAPDERSIEHSCGKMEESHRRQVLLQAYRGRCGGERQALSEDVRKVSGHCQALGQLSRKAEEKLMLPTEAFGSPGAEPQVLRQVRELRDDRQTFLQGLLRRPTSAAPDLTRDERSAAFQYWLSTVKNVLCNAPADHFLSALQYLASEQEMMLKEKVASADMARDVAALRFRYESGHLVDISTEEELPPVSSLLQAAWEEEEQRLVDLAQTRARTLQLQAQQKQELLSLCVSDVELQCVVQRAVRDSVRDQCLGIMQRAREGQGSLRNLAKQRQSVLHFRQLVGVTQGQIRGLIKGNSTAKSALTRRHAEIGEAVQVMQTLFEEIPSSANRLRNAVSQETRQFAPVSLDALDRRTIQGVQRVPVKWLSIHRLDSFLPLCQSLSFPLYRAPERLCSQVLSQRLQLLSQRRLLQLHTSSLEDVHWSTSDQQALSRVLCEEDQALLASLLPRVEQLSLLCSRGFTSGHTLKTTLHHWWEQPGQCALPDLSKGGLTFQQWLHRWRLASSKV